MGLTYIQGVVKGPTGKKVRVNLLVDGGAKYTLLSEKHWMAIKLKPSRTMTFILADGGRLYEVFQSASFRCRRGKAIPLLF